MNRKIFLTSSAASIAGFCVTPVAAITTFTNQEHTFLSTLNRLETFRLQNLSASFNKAYNAFLNTRVAKNYTLDANNIYKLRVTCYALPVKKTSFFSESNELVLFVKNTFGYKHYILDENMIGAYDHIISNYEENSKVMDLDLDVLKFIAPTKILGTTKKSGKKQLTFQNSFGNRITLVTTPKKNYSIVC